LHHSRLLS